MTLRRRCTHLPDKEVEAQRGWWHTTVFLVKLDELTVWLYFFNCYPIPTSPMCSCHGHHYLRLVYRSRQLPVWSNFPLLSKWPPITPRTTPGTARIQKEFTTHHWVIFFNELTGSVSDVYMEGDKEHLFFWIYTLREGEYMTYFG